MISFFGLKPKISPNFERKFRIWLILVFVLSFLVTMAFTLDDLLRKPGALQFIGANLEQIYLSSQVITVVTCSVYAVVILGLRSRAAAYESWADYIGLAFIVLVLHYMILFWFGASSSTPAHDWYTNIFSTSLSALSNVFLIAAGRVLLNRAPSFGWNIVMQAGCAASGVILSLLNIRGQRFPDAIASAFCIYWIGYALLINIRYIDIGFSDLTRKIIGRVLMVSVFLYVLSGLFWASTPFLTKWDWNMRFMAEIEGAAQREAQNHSKRIEGEGQRENSPRVSAEPELVKRRIRGLLLDTAIIILLCLLKFVIFLAIFFLLLGAIIFVSSKHANEIFDPIVHEVSEYLAGDGLTKLVADRLDAAGAVVLYVSIPGKRKSRYAEFLWPNDKSTQYEPTIVDLQWLDELALEAIRSGEEQKFSLSRRELMAVARIFPLTYANRLPTKMAVPIIFHGAVIGCLLVISKPDRNFSPREIQHIRDLAKLSTLSIQSYRENAALDQLSYRFSRATTLNKFSTKTIEKADFNKAIDKIVEVLHDVLNPLATGIWLDTGLQQCVSLMGEENRCKELEQLVNRNETSGQKLKLLHTELEVKRFDNSDPYTIGKLAILVPAEKDYLNDPILGRNHIHFRAVTARTVSVLVGVMTEYLSAVIQEFGAKVNNLQPMSIEEWIRQLGMAAEKAGTLWIVAEVNGEERPLGRPEAIGAFRQLRNKDGEGRRYLRSVRLEHSDGKLQIGVRGSIYANDQNVCPLWRASFVEFAEIADSALQRVTHHLEHSAARSYEAGTLSVTTTEIVHQIVNTARDIILPLETIHEHFLMDRLTCSDERVEEHIKSLPQYADSLLELTAGFKKLSDSEKTGGAKKDVKCSLLQAAVQAERLYAPSLKSCGIILDTDIPGALTVSVPLPVAVMAIANLISNSKDAMGNGGHIRIKAWQEGNMIRCDVTDDGPGVSPEVQPRLFHERNVTTKQNGNGWGLYLVSRSLEDRRGSIKLTDSRPGETTFTILFPNYNGS
jgi:hypothetical protein